MGDVTITHIFLYSFSIYEKENTMSYTSLTEIKQHLNIESGFTTDDQYLLHLINVSELAISNYSNYGLTGYTGTTGATAMPETVKHAVLLLAGNFYINRVPVSFAQGTEIPYTIRFLLSKHKRNAIC